MKHVIASCILLSAISINANAVDVNCATGNNQTVFDDANMNCFVNNTAADAEKVNANFKALLDQLNPPGLVSAFAGAKTAVPTGWILCDGSAVSRTTYAKLFAVIGTIHGEGDGSTTFNLPDYRGRFLRGVDDGAGRDSDAASRTASNSGGNTGDLVGSVQEDELNSHRHSYTSYDTANYASGATYARRGGSGSNSGYTGGSETRPKNAYVHWMIKY